MSFQKVKALRTEAKKAVEAADKKQERHRPNMKKAGRATDILTVAKESNWLYEKFGDGVYADVLGL